MVIKHKLEIAPGSFVNAETQIPDLLIAVLFVTVTLSIYNYTQIKVK